MNRLTMPQNPRLATLLIPALLAAGCSDFSMEPTRTPTELRVTPEDALLETGDTLEFQIELLDENGEAYATIPSWSPPLWSSDRPERVDLTGGMVRPILGGATNLQVELAGLTADVRLRANPATMDMSVPLLYITQGVQRPDADVPLIAGRTGLLRVVVQGHDENYYQPRVRATFHNGGSVVHTATLELGAQGLPTAVEEGSMLRSYNGVIPGEVLQPGVRLEVQVDPEGVVPTVGGTAVRVPQTGTLDLGVREVPPFRLMMVPVDQAANGRTSRLTQAHAENMTVLTQDIFPFSDFQVEVRQPYVTEELLSTDDGWYNLIEDIAFLRLDDGNPHYYYGGFDRPAGTTIGGLGYVGYPVAIGMDNRADVIAHEIGHNLSLPHAPCGGPANPDPNYPYQGGYVGMYGYDRTRGLLQNPRQKFDLMSYCDPIWISDYNYEKVMTYRDASEFDSAFLGAAGLRSAADRSAAEGQTLVVRGGVRSGRLMLSPALEWEGPVSVPSAAGWYTLQGLDEAGAVVFSVAVEPRRLDHGQDAHFVIALPADRAQPERLARLRLSGPEGTVERVRSRGADRRHPDATLRGRGAPGVAANRASVSWDAGEYPLAVVRDRDTGRIRAMSRTGRVTLPTDTDAGRLEVLLSDGLRTHRANVVQR